MSSWLHEKTDVYFDKNMIYEIFSQAEDYPWYILSHLIEYTKGQEIIDFGCGTGKYTYALSPYTTHIHAIDASENQIAYTKQRNNHHKNISYYTISNWKIPKNTASCMIACRVLGTIKDISIRTNIFKNIINTLSPWFTIYFIENDTSWEFEEIRGKTTDISLPTITYNRWLVEQWCIPIHNIDTFFQFSSIEEARNIFTAIRWEWVWKKITSSKIQHKVIIYKYVV